MTKDVIQIITSCNCNKVHHTFSIPTSTLPLPAILCNCNSARLISGALFTSYILLEGYDSFGKVGCDGLKMVGYESEDGGVKRWFCGDCGSHVYREGGGGGGLGVASGVVKWEGVDEEGAELIKWMVCDKWYGEEKGVDTFLTHIDGEKLELRRKKDRLPSHLDTITSTNTKAPRQSTKSTSETVQAHCHCKGVNFYITPPNTSSSTSTRSPYPDLMIPAHTGGNPNLENKPWWLPSPTRYLAGTCTCPPCRTASGFDITFWSFIPTCNIFLDTTLTKPFTTTQTWGSLKTYSSSKGVTRGFCGICGANVFWAGSKDIQGREGLIDIAVGLIGGEGVERMLAWWTERVSFAEEAGDGKLVRGLEDGLGEWAVVNRGSGGVARHDFEV